MAIERNIPDDIQKYEPKLIGPLSKRQLLSIVPAAVIAVAAFYGIGDALPTEAKLFITMIIGVPFLLVGWYKPYGLPFEDFVKTVAVSMVLSPKHRKYKTKRYDDVD